MGRLFAVSVVVFACAISTSAAAQGNDKYCDSSGRIVLFAVDITTPYDQADKDAIVSMTDRILSSLRGGERFVIRTISDSHTHSERLVEGCVPYCPSSGVFGRLFNCSDGLIRTDSELMRREVINALKRRLSSFVEQQYSDIVRTIAAISNEEFKDGRKKTLYIYSDLVERSDYFSAQYLFSYSLKRLLYGIEYYKINANLSGADVHVAGVGRSDMKDRHPLKVTELNKLKEFWDALFKKFGAASVTISQHPL